MHLGFQIVEIMVVEIMATHYEGLLFQWFSQFFYLMANHNGVVSVVFSNCGNNGKSLGVIVSVVFSTCGNNDNSL